METTRSRPRPGQSSTPQSPPWHWRLCPNCGDHHLAGYLTLLTGAYGLRARCTFCGHTAPSRDFARMCVPGRAPLPPQRGDFHVRLYRALRRLHASDGDGETAEAAAA